MEEVALHEPEVKPAKKRGMLSRIMDSNDSHVDKSQHHEKDGKGSSWHHFGGRKRGQSGSGAELGSIPKREETPKPAVGESGLRREEVVPSQPQPQPQPSIQVQTPQQQALPGAEKENAQAPIVVS
jgi:hypothetical protein